MSMPLAHITPNLENLEIDVSSIGNSHWLRDPFVNLKTLRRLHITAQVHWDGERMLQFYFRTVIDGTQLESLKIHDHYDQTREIPVLPSSLAIPPSPVSNTSLTSLSVWDNPAIRFFVSKVSLPCLTSLQLSQDSASFSLPDDSLEQDVWQLVLWSGCKPSKLSLDFRATSQALVSQIPALLQYLTTLEDLELNLVHRELPYFEFSAGILEGMAHRAKSSRLGTFPDFLPSLVSLVCTDREVSRVGFLFGLIEWFQEFVEDPRRRCNGAVTTIATIDLGPPNYGDDEDWDDDKDFSPVWTNTGPDEVCTRPSAADRGGYRPLKYAELWAGDLRFGRPLYSRSVK